MNPVDMHDAIAVVPLPEGYRFELLRRDESRELISLMERWYPDIAVGTASALLRESFYRDRVAFTPAAGRDMFVVTIRHGVQLAGVVAFEREPDASTLYGRLAVVAPVHRGAGLGQRSVALMESMGRALGMGLAYGLATMKHPHIQRAFERLGWQLIGIAPGLDRELVGGEVRRVHEAIYAKLLPAAEELHRPRPEDLTPRVRRLYQRLFVGCPRIAMGTAP